MAKQAENSRTEDTLIYRIIAAVGIAIAVEVILVWIYQAYSIGNTFLQVRASIMWGGIAGAAVMVAGLTIAAIARNKKGLRPLGVTLAVTGAAIGICCYLMYFYYLNAIRILWIAFPAAAVFYLIYCIYQREFFLLSLLSGLYIFGLYAFSRLYNHVTVSPLAIVANIGLLVLLALVFALFQTGKNKRGKGGRAVTLFLKQDANYFLVYMTCGVLLLCQAVALILGAMASYVCFFIALAYWFVLAIYYTIKLIQ